jgi:hypothetical protein
MRLFLLGMALALIGLVGCAWEVWRGEKARGRGGEGARRR